MDKDDIKDALEDFKLCSEAETDQRKESLDDLHFARLGEQWPADVKKQRDAEHRPCLTINRLPAFIKQVTNDARQNRPSITVHPVGDGADKETAEIFNGLIRNIQNVSRADIVYDTALDFAVTMGFGYWIVRDQYTCEDSFEQDLVIERVSNPFSVYGDWQSKEATSVDWNRAFVTDLYSEAGFKKRWPGAQFSGFDEGDEGRALWFVDSKLRVAEYWTRDEVTGKLLKLTDGTVLDEVDFLRKGEGGLTLRDVFMARGVDVEADRPMRKYKVVQKIMSGVETLETNDWRGKYIPIVPVYGDEINVEGKRYFQSLVRFAKDPARMFNYWRTASTELVALAPKAPYVGPVGSFVTDAAKWQQANNASLPFIEYDIVQGGVRPERQPFSGVPAGALQEALNASDDLKNIMGLHDASLGARSNETSGVAITARQREGDVSTFNFTDNLTRAIEHTGAILVDLIPKVYSEARMIRCIKEDGSTFAVPINQPVAPAQPEDGQPPMPGQTQQQYQPAPEEVPGLTRIFDLTAGKYDVTVMAGPSFTTKRQEATQGMMEFIKALPGAGAVTADLVAKSQDWPHADEFAARLKAMIPPQALGQAQGGPSPAEQQMHAQMQQMDQQAKEAVGTLQQQLQQTQQELQQVQQAAADKRAEQATKNRELQIKAFEAQTERIKIVGDAAARSREHQLDVIEAATAAAQPQPLSPNVAEQPPAM